MIKTRVSRVRKLIKKQGLDALVVSLPVNRRYLSGYSAEDGQWGESSGWLVIAHTALVLITDARYGLSAQEQATLYDLRLHQKGLAVETAAVCADLGVKRLGLEAEGMLLEWQLELSRQMSGVELIPTRGLVSAVRVIKDPGEVATMEASLAIMEKVLGRLLDQGLEGKSELELALALMRGVEDAGADGPAFDPIVAAGPAAAEPHAVPGATVIAPGQLVLFDVGARLNGYCSDLSRTVVAGGWQEADQRFHQVYQVVREAQLAALEGIRPGMTGSQADALAREVISEAGYGEYFNHSLGHGVGLATHEAPSLSPRANQALRPGMVFTIEPGIYLPGWGGIRLEQMAVMENDGCRLLNHLDHFLPA
jgi:Xaa-Pro aminopeptidase